jgi:transposase
MEASASSHYWGRELSRIGHEVCLSPPTYVKPFVKRQKNDAADAEAICEASQRPTMRFVQIKVKQPKLRQLSFGLVISSCASAHKSNAQRGHLAEFGLVVPTGPAHVGRLLAEAEDCSRSLPQACVRSLVYNICYCMLLAVVAKFNIRKATWFKHILPCA